MPITKKKRNGKQCKFASYIWPSLPQNNEMFQSKWYQNQKLTENNTADKKKQIEFTNQRNSYHHCHNDLRNEYET